jgi:hypothetical protein
MLNVDMIGVPACQANPTTGFIFVLIVDIAAGANRDRVRIPVAPRTVSMLIDLNSMPVAVASFVVLSSVSQASDAGTQTEQIDESNISQTASDWIDDENSIDFVRVEGDEIDIDYTLSNSNWWTVIYVDQRIERAYAICADQGIIDVRTDGNSQAVSVLPDQCVVLSGYRLDIRAQQGRAAGTIQVVNWE